MTYEFANLTPEAVGCCVEFGASNLVGFLKGNAFEYIVKSGFPTNVEEARQVDKNLARLMCVFGLGGLPDVSIDQVQLPSTDILDVPPFSSPAHLDWHTDSVPKVGLSLLMPIRGGSARFEFRDSRDQQTHFLHYKETDVLMLRQYISTYNGMTVNKRQTEHRGIAETTRVIYTVDIQNENLVTDFTE